MPIGKCEFECIFLVAGKTLKQLMVFRAFSTTTMDHGIVYHKFVSLLLCVLLSSCSTNSANTNPPKKNSDTGFWVEEAPLEVGILKIHLPETRPQNMSIESPGGEWFIVQSQEDHIEALPQSQFDSLKVIIFNLKDLNGVIWRDGVKSIERVFKQTGNYRIYFANNLGNL